ncbi:GspH/FimT family pseudopilin [Saccharospirillum salsuginis]|uniref:GspH/FimT family pseudopilin n=1 Tax=Saccharospirillum salsuginis TaxID=418750 RepID=UPI0016757A2D
MTYSSPIHKSGFTIIELLIVVVLLGITSSIIVPLFFNSSSSFNVHQEFQSALTYTRNRTLTSQCSHEVRLTTSGWSVLRDSDCQIDTSGCPLELNVSVSDPYGDSLTGGASTASLQRLIFTPDGRLYQRNSGSGCTTLPSSVVSAGTTLAITPSATLRLDGLTAYAAIQ